MIRTVVLLLFLLLSACSYSKDRSATESSPQSQASDQSPKSGDPNDPEKEILVPGDGWVTERDSNGNLAELTIRKMTPFERERIRGEVSRNNVMWVNSRTGYSFYKLSGSERFEKNAFILPKILVIGGVDGGRASLRELPSGKVSLTIPIALIDGSQRELPYSTSRIRIPDSLFLDDAKRSIIGQELVDTFGYEHELSNLGSCPKRIVIKVAGAEHDVTPRVFGGPNGPTGCQANQPFTVTIQGPRKSIERFLSEDVFNGAAEIAAMYEVAGSYVDEIRLYMFKTASIYDQLKTKLIVQKGSEKELKGITDEEADKILLPFVQQAVSKWAAKEPLVERVRNTAVAQMKIALFDESQGDTGKLLMLRDESVFKPIDIPVRVLNESLGREGELFYSSSIIKPIHNSTNIAIRGEERQELGKPPIKGIAQDVFTVRDGDEYELQLTSLVVHEYEFGDEHAQPKIQDKGLVCLDKPGDALPACRKYKNECTDYKHFCKRQKIGCVKFGTRYECHEERDLSVLGCLTLGIFGGCSIVRKCELVPDNSVCTEYGTVGCDEMASYCSQTQQTCEPGFEEPLCRNQITDLRISRYFSAPVPVNNRVINAPLGNSDQDLVSGITLRFRWPNGKSIDCLLLTLLKEVNGQSVRFKVQNNHYCKPFPDGYKGEPVLSIVNRVSTERRNIPCGIMNYSTIEGTKFYGCNGFNAVELTPDQYRPGERPNISNFSRSPLYLTYFPVVDVNGILISRSGAFTSGSTTEEKWGD